MPLSAFDDCVQSTTAACGGRGKCIPHLPFTHGGGRVAGRRLIGFGRALIKAPGLMGVGCGSGAENITVMAPHAIGVKRPGRIGLALKWRRAAPQRFMCCTAAIIPRV